MKVQPEDELFEDDGPDIVEWRAEMKRKSDELRATELYNQCAECMKGVDDPDVRPCFDCGNVLCRNCYEWHLC